ncbi:MAG: TonB-dependent receptor plug domain-containing protein [Burkholderiaceae bacterium]
MPTTFDLTDLSMHREARLPKQEAFLAGLLFAAAISANAAETPPADLADLSLEDLGGIRVTSVSKRSELLADAPASIFVITAEDIRRSAATTLPEVLRLAPNLLVARTDARNYAISSRGFNNVFANKLLVLIDGRTVYTPLFSGTFWDAQDVVLEDIERIEVISGPGSTIWGSNAVNGVINVITRSASGTQGALASGGASKNERQGTVRYGGALDGGGYYRVYGKHLDADDTYTARGVSTRTGWKREQTGFRADWGNASDGFTLQGDAYSGKLHQLNTRDISIQGANLLARLNRVLDGGSQFSFQAYWDFTERNQPLAFVDHLNTLDLEAKHSILLAGIHNVVWGGGYRVAFDRIDNDVQFAFLPARLNMHWANVFVQDEIELRKDLKLTAGLKFEDNHYTGIESLPTLRLAWKPDDRSLLWGSASRAVRAPSRFDRDLFSPPQPLPIGQFLTAGGPDFDSEVAKTFELGYRAQPTETLSYSITAFRTRYDKLRTLEPGPLGLNYQFENRAEGRAKGVELWGDWQARPSWKLSLGGVVQSVKTVLDSDSRDASATFGFVSASPSHQWMLRSSHDLGHDKELDVTLRRVGGLSDPTVPSYTELDARFGWKLRRDIELSLIGQNLLDRSHPEFGSAPGRSEIERALFVKLLWRL